MLQTGKPTIVISYVDRPTNRALVHRHGFNIAGWFFDSSGNVTVASVEARLAGVLVGSTRLLYDRPDVRRIHPGAGERSGFELLCTLPEALRDRPAAQIQLFARYADGAENLIRTFKVRFSEIDYRQHGHGYMLTDDFTRIMRRENMYGSGPPSPIADRRCVNLILRYIDRTGSLLDVGCGIGAYGKEMRQRGIDWHGVEVIPEFCERMNAEGLPNTLVEPGTLPFPDGSFDSAISIEVVEHIDDYETFVAQIARVVRGTACFSVPNAEQIAVLSYMHALPWHMLESDHKNFFSRGSLAALLRRHFASVEVFAYGELPNIRSYDGIDVQNHLFAVARHTPA